MIGRERESTVLRQALQSNQAELVAVVGRRRVGKTFLVETVLEEVLDLEVTGVPNGTTRPQIQNFQELVGELGEVRLDRARDWNTAFLQLRRVLKSLPEVDRKRVLFFDELPWLASPRSGFLEAFSFFWNNYAVKNKLLVVICGSAASWMIRKVIDHKGGLYNRVTRRIDLEPFNLYETERYLLQEKQMRLKRRQIVQLYLVMGGIPHYLNQLDPAKSAAQNIDDLCFARGGFLRREFDRLYPALFEQAEKHVAVVRALSSKWRGLTRTELSHVSGVPSGGTLTRILQGLEFSGFIRRYYSLMRKKKQQLYRLTDEYSSFYLKFIDGKRPQEAGGWITLLNMGAYHAWTGYAFEGVCLKHDHQIKQALQIAGMYVETSTFQFVGNDEVPGTQIDMLLDRADDCVNICEVKFSKEKYVVTKEYADKLATKKMVLDYVLRGRKQLFLTLISATGLSKNAHSQDVIDQVVELDALFESII